MKERVVSGFNVSRAMNIFEDSELEALLAEDPSQTQEELAESLGVIQQAISKRLKAMGMIQKQGHWVPYELKPRDVERRFFACEQLLQRQNQKGFLHHIVTGDGKWVHHNNPKRRKSWEMLGHATTSTARPYIHGGKVMLCIWWDQLGVVYYVWYIIISVNHHRGSVSNVIDAFEPNIERETAIVPRETR